MQAYSASAIAHPNIAFIKYWGNRDQELRLPASGSISMNLAGLETRTTVAFDADLSTDILRLNGQVAEEAATQRVGQFLDLVRGLAGIQTFASVESANNFPMGSGIASSASAFAALALAASRAAGLELEEKALSILARKGSGSASRSIPSGFVEWYAGNQDEDSYAQSIAAPDHWELVDCIAVVDEEHKATGSSAGHPLAETSPYQAARLASAPKRIARIKQAIQARDFANFAEIVEADSLLMHAVMMTSTPSLLYWSPASVRVLKACRNWRKQGLSLASTMDAGPNVHVICPAEAEKELVALLAATGGVKRILVAKAGRGARRIS